MKQLLQEKLYIFIFVYPWPWRPLLRRKKNLAKQKYSKYGEIHIVVPLNINYVLGYKD